jgi:hypothetical protein
VAPRLPGETKRSCWPLLMTRRLEVKIVKLDLAPTSREA